jgi:hypothetical protein
MSRPQSPACYSFTQTAIYTEHKIICFGTRLIILLEKLKRAVAIGQVFKIPIGICVTYECEFE